MDFSSHLAAILGAVALMLLYNLLRSKKHRHIKIKGKLAPEASGGLPIIGHLHLLGGPKILARTLGAIADQHGPLFTIWLGMRRTVVISSYESMKQCFTTNDKVLATRPQSSQGKYLAYNYAGLGLSPYGAYWRDVRKLAIVELLSNQRIKSLKHIQVSELSDLIKHLYLLSKSNENGSNKIVISKKLDHLTLNVITRMVVGKKFFDSTDDDGSNEKRRPIAKIMREFMYLLAVLVPSDLVPFLGWMDFQGTVKRMKRVARELDSIMEDWIEEHKMRRLESETKNENDIIDVMLSTIGDDSTLGLPRETIIKATILTLIAGGSDTTFVSMTWVLSNLLNHRRALELAQEELDLKVGRNRCVEDSDIENLVYLQAVIKETMRLYPPSPLGIPREAMEDCCLGGYHISKGTRLITNLWKLHRDPSIWSNPDEFKPERFLTSQANLDVNGQNFEYLPFGSGRRVCPGINFAMPMLHLTLAKLLQSFNWATPSDEPVDMTECLGISLSKATPLEVLLTPRLAPELYPL